MQEFTFDCEPRLILPVHFVEMGKSCFKGKNPGDRKENQVKTEKAPLSSPDNNDSIIEIQLFNVIMLMYLFSSGQTVGARAQIHRLLK